MSERVNGDRRPSPDALLKLAAGAERGRLRIFLGAAPGVGKTYEMLSAARVRRGEGVDVVIGVVETHGRAETAALMVGLEAIPLRKVDYQGRTLEEMDLDAILLRRPGIVLVDELAHTNAPGSRHPKRYQDVQELLEAGIDVYTTLNIQHVESLNDVVARITRIRVRETVPDSVIDRADDIELVDLTPADLIQRLHDGKVYVPAQARRAVDHYFRIGNLTALRELALRRTAQRVDDQMVDYMRSHAIEGPWPAGERVLVCVGGDAPSDGLVRQARRLADRFRAPWTAINVETPGQLRDDARQQAWATEALRLAQRLGGETVVVPGQDVVGAVIEHARAYNATHIMVGNSVIPRGIPRGIPGGIPGGIPTWRRLFGRSVAHGLIHRAGGIATSLRARGVTLDGETRDALLATVIDETERLNRFIGNLLDMTRLEAGVLRPRMSLTVLSDVIGAALQRASGILSGHEIAVDLPPNLPMLDLDMVLFEQVLFNLLDNAAKYAPPGSLIRLQAEQDGDVVRLRVIDEGDGIPPVDLNRIFDKFYRSGGGDRRRAGTGLGLAICRGFVEAMGGSIEASNRGDRPGSVFTLAFPVPVLTPIEQEVTE